MTSTLPIQSEEGPKEAEILYRSGGVVVHAALRKSGAAGLGDVTVPRLEAKDGDLGGRPATGEKIVAALEKAGVEFTNDDQPGVRLKPPKPRRLDKHRV